MGRLYETVQATAEPTRQTSMPNWLVTALRGQFNLGLEELSSITEQQGQDMLMKHCSSHREP